MCFSTEASFTSGIVLTAIGSATVKNTSSRSQLFLASIPLLFGLQQFAEGFVWLHLSQHVGSQNQFINAQQTFLAFALLVWPIWIPLSLAVVETEKWRRLLLWVNTFFGCVLSLIYLWIGSKEEVDVRVVNHSLQYMGHIPEQFLLSIFYPLVVLFPMFLSSVKNVWIFGIFVAIGYLLAEYFYQQTFVSVWCFFAAIVSIFIYKILKDYQLSMEKEPLNRS